MMNNIVSVPGTLAAVGNVLFPAFDYMQGCFPRAGREEVLKRIAPAVKSSQLFETFFEKKSAVIACHTGPSGRAKFGGMIVPFFFLKKKKKKKTLWYYQ